MGTAASAIIIYTHTRAFWALVDAIDAIYIASRWATPHGHDNRTTNERTDRWINAVCLRCVVVLMLFLRDADSTIFSVMMA